MWGLPMLAIEPAVTLAAPFLPEGAARRPRVLMITVDFPPPATMAGETCAQIARHLPLHGWEPVVLAARHPGGATGHGSGSGDTLPTVIRVGSLPHPIFVYRRLAALRRARPAAAQGIDAAQWSPPRRGLKRWILSMLQVPDVYSGWIPPAVIAGLRAIRRYRVSHLFSASPHSSGHLVGLALARLSGLPWTAQFQDPWTFPPDAVWHNMTLVSPLSARLETALERMVVRRADTVACVTEPHRLWMRRQHPDAPEAKIVTIPNGYDGPEWERVDAELGRTGGRRDDRFVITYAGNIYLKRNPAPVFRALRSLIDSGDVARERIQVDLLGQCDVAAGSRVTSLAAACGLADRVTITGPLPREEALLRVARSDLLLLLAEELTLQIPGKTYEYLRARRPILALTSAGAPADLLRRTGGAWVVDPDDQEGIVAAVREAYRLRRDGLPAPTPDPDLVARFDRRILAGEFAAIFDRAVRAPARVG
jgi:glycosyltransferase involved in cell wall biosynthesis